MFSRKQVVHPRPTDLNEQIENSLKMYRRLLGEDIIIKFLAGQKLPMIMADSQQLDQVLTNLLINARDAILACTDKERQRIVTIRTSLVELERSLQLQDDIEPGLYLCMEVNDTGHGIDNQLKSLIFEPFFTTKGEGKGTGLGLSTVFGVVKQNKGTIHVYSEDGLGATFKIYWPIIKTITEHKLTEQKNTLHLGGHETLLLVEDETDVLNFAVEVLTDLGYRVT